MRKQIAVACWTLSCLCLLWCGGISWFVKDGLGPDAIETYGALAWQHFWRMFGWTSVLFVFVPLALGFCIWPWRKKKAA